MQTESANTLNLPVVDLAARTASAMTMSQYAEAFLIENPADAAKALEARGRVSNELKDFKARLKDRTDAIRAIEAATRKDYAPVIEALEQSLALFDKKSIAWDDAQKAIQRDAQRKVEAAAAAERKRLQDEAAERQRKADADAAAKRKAAEDAAAAGRLEEAARFTAQAERVEEKAAQRVETLQERASQVVAPIIQPQTAKVSGTSFRDNWKWRLKDIARIKAGFKHETTTDAAIDAIVKSMKGNVEQITAIVGDGIEIYNDRIVSSRRA